MFKFIGLLLSALVLSACATTGISTRATHKLTLGMTRSQVASTLGTEPQAWLPVTYRGKTLQVAVYHLPNKKYKSPKFMVAYSRRDVVNYWGYPKNFAHSKDAMIRAIGLSAKSALHKVNLAEHR